MKHTAALFTLSDRINRLANQARAELREPTEVFLGPEERQTLVEGLRANAGFFSAAGCPVHATPDQLDGARFSGLTIRCLQTNGIRVGWSLGEGE